MNRAIRCNRTALLLAGACLFAGHTAISPVDAAGAAPPSEGQQSGTSEMVALVWPEPPEVSRIEYVHTLVSESSFGKKDSFRESFMQLLTGKQPPRHQLYQPVDIAVSDDGQRIYISDFGQMQVFVFDLGHEEVTILGGENAFARPFGIALDESENLFLVEQDSRTVSVIAPGGAMLRRFTHESLVRPADIAIDRDRGFVYVADPARQAADDHSVKVFDYEGNLLRTVGGGRGDCEGCLMFPTYVEVDGAGNVYVTSTLNARVDVFDPEGTYVKTIGERGNAFGMFDKPKGVAVDSFGNVYVADSGWSNVQIFNPDGEVLLYFGGRGGYPGLMRNPTGIAIDRENRVYVADYLNYRVTSYQLVNTTAGDSFLDPDGTQGGESTKKSSGGGNEESSTEVPNTARQER